jgi:hypothetical protein
MWRYSRRRSSRRPAGAAGLLALASTTSALSLANFQIITSNAIPSPCIVAYNSPIAGCSTTDFTNGNQCSTLCANGLLAEASIVEAICGGLEVNPQSLLGLTLDGKLLDTLCPGLNTGTTTVKVTVQPSTTKAASTTTLDRTLTTTSSSIIRTTTTISSSTETTSSTAIINAPSQTSSTTQASAVTTNTVSQTSSTSDTATSTTTTQEAGATRGGGSPFDTVVQNQATNLAMFSNVGTMAAVLGAVVLLF